MHGIDLDCYGGEVFSSENIYLCYRMMYWTVIGDHSYIEESAMDGSLRRVLLEKNLRRPTGRPIKARNYFCCFTHLSCLDFDIFKVEV